MEGRTAENNGGGHSVDCLWEVLREKKAMFTGEDKTCNISARTLVKRILNLHGA